MRSCWRRRIGHARRDRDPTMPVTTRRSTWRSCSNIWGGVHGNPLPPGVTVKEAGSKTLLGPKETKGKIILQAAPTAAACDKVPIAVMGHVSINFVVKTAYASAPILVTVRPKEK